MANPVPLDFPNFQVQIPQFSFGQPKRDMNKLLEEAMNPTYEKHRSVKSAFGKAKNHCLCKILRPFIILWQIGGVLPVSHDQKTCKMRHKWISIPAFVNLFWIIVNIIGITIAIPTALNIFETKFRGGIDMYAFSIVMVVQYSSTMIILIVGNYSAPRFMKAWTELHAITQELELPNYRRLKRLMYILPLYLTHDLFVGYIVNSLLRMSGDMKMADMPWIVHTSRLTANVIPNLVTAIYCVFISIATQNFKIINKRLRNILEKQSTLVNTGKHQNPLLPLQISRFRMLHEKLCNVIRLLEDAFGVQILAVFTATCVSLETGIYSLIVGFQGLAPPGMNSLVMGFGISTIIASLRVVLLVWICQTIMNEANGTAHILNRLNSETHTREVDNQVGKFLKKLGGFPLQTMCCNIFPLGNGFYASAASVIVTYVLILLQFRMDE